MIYVSGDVHGDIDDLFESAHIAIDDNCTKDDVLIICGDFGFLWWDNYNSTKVAPENPEIFLNKQEKQLDRIEKDFPTTVVFVDGNHENHSLFNTYHLVQWNGGMAHQIRPHIYHLCRGQIFTIEGLKFYAFGGAHSHDISGGLLDADDPRWYEKMVELEERRALFRTKRVDWWYEEFPTQKEMEEGLARLAAADYKVDYIISHDCPGCLKHKVHWDKGDELNEYFNEVYYKCFDNLKMWYFGHYHMNRMVDSKATCLYHKVERIN